MGPMLGAIVILLNISLKFAGYGTQTYPKDTALTKDPLSAGDATSVMTPYAIENVPEDVSNQSKTGMRSMPEIARACSTRRPRSAEYVFDRTMAILAPT